MGGKAEERLGWKEPLHSLEVELLQEFGLSPIGSRALIRRIGEFLEDYTGTGAGGRNPGQVSYPAVALGERAGKPFALLPDGSGGSDGAASLRRSDPSQRW